MRSSGLMEEGVDRVGFRHKDSEHVLNCSKTGAYSTSNLSLWNALY